MKRSETANGAVPLTRAWSVAGRQFAAGSGALVALLSLLADAPVRVASLRGAVTFLSLLLLTRCGAWIGERTAKRPEPVIAGTETTPDTPQ